MVFFWNLRACGQDVSFVSLNEMDRVKAFVQERINHFDKLPSNHPDYEDFIGAYFTSGDHKNYAKQLDIYQHKKKFIFSHIDDVSRNGFNIVPSKPTFKEKTVVAIVDAENNKYSVTIPLPEKPFSDRRLQSQNYVISFSNSLDYAYPGYTLRLPFLPSLNEFYGRQICFDPWTLRVGHNRVNLIEHMNRESITVYPIKKEDLILKIFENASIKPLISVGGRLAGLILKKMGTIEDCRVFKIKGVRYLLAQTNRRICWTEAGKVIYEMNFDKFKDLYIEYRRKKMLSPTDVLQFLVKKEVFVPKLKRWHTIVSGIFFRRVNFNCENCGLLSRINYLDFSGRWMCKYCSHNHYLPLFIRQKLSNERKNWELTKNGIFSKDNNQEGSIPVILTIMQLNRLLGHGHDLLWMPSVKLTGNGFSCETDLIAVHLGPRFDEQDIQIAIGECKTEMEITNQDVDNLCNVKEQLEKAGLKCFLIFSKTADSFSNQEIDRFKKLATEKRISPILFTNDELEPYEPYWHHPKQNILPHKYAHSFKEIAENSMAIYLNLSVGYTAANEWTF